MANRERMIAAGQSGKLLLLGTAEGARPVRTLLYAMAGRQALVSKAALALPSFAKPARDGRFITPLGGGAGGVAACRGLAPTHFVPLAVTRRRRQFRSCSPAVTTRSSWGLSSASTGPVATRQG